MLVTNQLFISFATSEISAKISHLQATVDLVSQWMSSNLLSLYQSKTEFLFIALPAQHSKISDLSLLIQSNTIITPTYSARILDVIFDSTLCMSDYISSVSKSCFLSIHDLCQIRNTLDYINGHIISTSLIHSKLDCCKLLFLNLPQSQLNRRQLILSSSDRAVFHIDLIKEIGFYHKILFHVSSELQYFSLKFLLFAYHLCLAYQHLHCFYICCTCLFQIVL